MIDIAAQPSKEDQEGNLDRPDAEASEQCRHQTRGLEASNEKQIIRTRHSLPSSHIENAVQVGSAVLPHERIAQEKAIGQDDKIIIGKELLKDFVTGIKANGNEWKGDCCRCPHDGLLGLSAFLDAAGHDWQVATYVECRHRDGFWDQTQVRLACNRHVSSVSDWAQGRVNLKSSWRMGRMKATFCVAATKSSL